ncbi:hypothetical protein TRFO_35616 [Tritrichomonas foetus]|uniref:Uncharacterized protein n=1 Tax=Tritrichomonas foetus TaxID=1144522 RepID=A0A1J4JH58_9EUKA|nr:hypothetical protein TRFO_35616 [Tritrichomonas foetus]|eukprot:OHS98049.1 hypothetical protein TRFO_35616 [Tritrichomonas foetus]
MEDYEAIELSDDEIEAIPQDKRVKIVQAQIEGGRAQLVDLYEKLEKEKVMNTELEFKIKELNQMLIDEKKKLQLKQKNNSKLTDQLRQLRGDVGQQEHKLRSFGIDSNNRSQTISNNDIERLAAQLDKEQANVLRLQVQLEKQNGELMKLDLQCKQEAESMKFDFCQIVEEKKKIMDLIGLEMQKLNILKQRNASALKGVSSRALDAQLTAVLESIANNA